MEGFKTVTPKEMSFTWKEWVWGICAYLRFWNKKFRSPYQGMQMRQALILMRLRNERPMTVEEVLEAYGDQIGSADHHFFQAPYERVPYVHVGNFGKCELRPTWSDQGRDKDHRFLVSRKD